MHHSGIIIYCSYFRVHIWSQQFPSYYIIVLHFFVKYLSNFFTLEYIYLYIYLVVSALEVIRCSCCLIMNNEFKTNARSKYICKFEVSDRFRQGSLFRDVFSSGMFSLQGCFLFRDVFSSGMKVSYLKWVLSPHIFIGRMNDWRTHSIKTLCLLINLYELF